MNYQRIILVGNATTDAEGKTSKKGDVNFTTFSVGVSGGKDRTTYFPVVVFGEKLAGVAKSYITKGRQVLVEGRIQVDEQRRFNVVADNIQLGVGRTRATRDGNGFPDKRANRAHANRERETEEETPAKKKVSKVRASSSQQTNRR